MSVDASPTSRRDAWILAAIVAAAFVLRVAYVLGQRGDILFDYPVVDEERYVAMARALASGQVPDPRPWFHPPGLVYALGLIFWAAGPGLLVPRLVQAAVSAGTCALTYVLAARFFERRVALGAAALCAVHGVLVFEVGELLPPTWMVAANMGALLLLVRAKDSGHPFAAFGAGATFGVAALFGPTVLPFVAFAAGWLRRPLLAAALVAGVVIPIAPVTWGNWQRGHEVVLVSTNGGINFLLGNEAHYPELLAVRPGPHWDDLREQPRRAGVLTEGGASSFYFARGAAFWKEHPVEAVGLYARKLYLFFDGPEIPRDTDLGAMRSSSWVLRVLTTRGPPWLPDGLLVPLALVGVVACWRARRPAVLAAFVGIQALVVAAFFVTARYRVPSLAILAMFASAGMDHCLASLRSSTTPARVLPVAAVLALTVPLNVVTAESAGDYGAELEFYRGLEVRNYLHDPAGAVPYFERASARDTHDARAPFELGNTESTLGHVDAAIAAWLVAEARDPWDGRSIRKATGALIARGDLAEAASRLEAHLRDPRREPAYYATDHLTLAGLDARLGQPVAALGELSEARRVDPAWTRANVAAFTRWVLAARDASRDAAFLDAIADVDAWAGETALAERARVLAAVARGSVVPSGP